MLPIAVVTAAPAAEAVDVHESSAAGSRGHPSKASHGSNSEGECGELAGDGGWVGSRATSGGAATPAPLSFIVSPSGRVGGALAQVGGALAQVGGALALVGGALALVGGALAHVGGALGVVGGALAQVGGALTQVGGAFAQMGGTLTITTRAAKCLPGKVKISDDFLRDPKICTLIL